MILSCPYCQHEAPLDAAPAGQFTVACPQCAKDYLITVPENPGETLLILGEASEEETSEAPVAADAAEAVEIAETVEAAEAPEAVEPEPTESPAPSVDAPEVTGTWPPPGAAQTSDVAGAADATLIIAENEHGPRPEERAPDADVDATILQAGSAVAATAAVAGKGTRPSAAGSRPTPASTPASTPGGSRPAATEKIPETLGGYKIVRELGRGAMGSVYLAKQLSLSRDVALKVMQAQYADDATFLARFTREAYAAAQLVHHNVVQIYDIGQDKGTSYFSMEFVDGQNLSAVVKAKNRLDNEEAVGYILQAARGLKFAHDHGMIHRDIKPDNLMLNTQGIVKVADLGLVKLPDVAEPAVPKDGKLTMPPVSETSAGITRVDSAMGTPAFMAPEQCRDAASVDHRADIYSLGCTLYNLVAGRPPFEGKTAMEVMTKHISEPITPPEVLVTRVSKGLSAIIQKMVAKRPEDRYNDLGEVITVLEAFLGESSHGPFTPKEEHADILEKAAAAFNASPTAKLRRLVLWGGFGLCAVMLIVFALPGKATLASAALGLGVMTSAACFILNGVTGSTYLSKKMRGLVLGSSLGEWLMGLAGLALAVGLLVILEQHWIWLACGIAGIVIALGIRFVIDRKVAAEQKPALDKVETMLRSLRLHGLGEEAIHQFVCKYAGAKWEPIYEALFGYEAKLAAREQWGRGEAGRGRPKSGVWREPILTWIDNKEKARRAEKDRKMLQKVEEKSLQAQGESPEAAREKARQQADAMVAAASEAIESRRKGGPPVSVSKTVSSVDWKTFTLPKRPRSNPLAVILAPHVRFLLGAVLLAASLTWMSENGVISKRQLTAVTNAAASGNVDRIKRTTTAEVGKATNKITQPLKIPMVPAAISAPLGSYGSAMAGLMLIISSFFAGWQMSLFVLPAAAVAVLGRTFGIPAIPGLDESLVPIAGGGILFVLGLLFGRTKKPKKIIYS